MFADRESVGAACSKPRALCFSLVLALVCGVAHAASALPTGHAEYAVSWNGIPAGAATVAVRHGVSDTPSSYRVDAYLHTNKLVDLLWRFRGHAMAEFGSTDLQPLGFRYDRRENAKHAVTDVSFDPTLTRATGVYQRDTDLRRMELREPGLLDPITAIFQALDRPAQIGDRWRYEIFTGEARYRVELTVTGEDTITVGAGRFRAWRVNPEVWKIGSGPDRRLRHATMWVAEDSTRLPLRIRSEVFIGGIDCDLIRFQAAP